jgi:hypothetical protein
MGHAGAEREQGQNGRRRAPAGKTTRLVEGHEITLLGMDVLGTVDAFSIDFRHAEIGVAPRTYDPSGHIPLTG